MEISAFDNGIKNCQLFPPYQGMTTFRIMIPPYESAAIIGIRLSFNAGAFNFRFQSRMTVGGPPQMNYNQSLNLGARFSNYLKFNISSNSSSNNALRTEEYKFIKRDIAKKLPIFNSNNFSTKDTLNQSMMIKQEITPQYLLQKYPNEFNILKYIPL